MKIIKKSIFTILIFFAALPVAIAQSTPSELRSMVDMRASYLDNEMNDHGYVHIKTEKSDVDIYSYWWNRSRNECVTTHVSDGRVQSLVSTLAVDCNKSSSGASRGYTSYTHNSYHHQTQRHSDNRQHEVAFDRGYKDGLYNKSFVNEYDDVNQQTEYSNGYSKGMEDRERRTSHHRSSHSASIGVDDLEGWLASSAYDELGARGFSEVRHYVEDDMGVKIFYNSRTSQCIKTVADKGDIFTIGRSSECN